MRVAVIPADETLRGFLQKEIHADRRARSRNDGSEVRVVGASERVPDRDLKVVVGTHGMSRFGGPSDQVVACINAAPAGSAEPPSTRVLCIRAESEDRSSATTEVMVEPDRHSLERELVVLMASAKRSPSFTQHKASDTNGGNELERHVGEVARRYGADPSLVCGALIATDGAPFDYDVIGFQQQHPPRGDDPEWWRRKLYDEHLKHTPVIDESSDEIVWLLLPEDFQHRFGEMMKLVSELAEKHFPKRVRVIQSAKSSRGSSGDGSSGDGASASDEDDDDDDNEGGAAAAAAAPPPRRDLGVWRDVKDMEELRRRGII